MTVHDFRVLATSFQVSRFIVAHEIKYFHIWKPRVHLRIDCIELHYFTIMIILCTMPCTYLVNKH